MSLQATVKSNILDAQFDDTPAEPTETANVASTEERRSAHLERLVSEVGQLKSERLDILARRELLRRHVDAVETVFDRKLNDINAALQLYEQGMNSLGSR